MELIFVSYRVWTLDFLIYSTCVAASDGDREHRDLGKYVRLPWER